MQLHFKHGSVSQKGSLSPPILSKTLTMNPVRASSFLPHEVTHGRIRESLTFFWP